MLSTCSIISRKNLNLKTKLEDILQSDRNSTLYLAPQLLDSDLPGAFLYGALPTHCLISSHKWTSPREWGLLCLASAVLGTHHAVNVDLSSRHPCSESPFPPHPTGALLYWNCGNHFEMIGHCDMVGYPAAPEDTVGVDGCMDGCNNTQLSCDLETMLIWY